MSVLKNGPSAHIGYLAVQITIFLCHFWFYRRFFRYFIRCQVAWHPSTGDAKEQHHEIWKKSFPYDNITRYTLLYFHVLFKYIMDMIWIEGCQYRDHTTEGNILIFVMLKFSVIQSAVNVTKTIVFFYFHTMKFSLTLTYVSSVFVDG